MPIAVTIILQLLETLGDVLPKIVPLFTQGQAVLSETDAAAIHASLQKVEAATAVLRPQVDAALDAASKK